MQSSSKVRVWVLKVERRRSRYREISKEGGRERLAKGKANRRDSQARMAELEVQDSDDESSSTERGEKRDRQDPGRYSHLRAGERVEEELSG